MSHISSSTRHYPHHSQAHWDTFISLQKLLYGDVKTKRGRWKHDLFVRLTSTSTRYHTIHVHVYVRFCNTVNNNAKTLRMASTKKKEFHHSAMVPKYKLIESRIILVVRRWFIIQTSCMFRVRCLLLGRISVVHSFWCRHPFSLPEQRSF